MREKTIKIILWAIIIVGAYFFLTKFPDEAILIGGISLILIIGSWLLELDKDNPLN